MSIKRDDTGRDGKGRFVKGYKGGGRKPMPDEFKAVCVAHALPALMAMVDIYKDKGEDASKRIAAGKIIIEYAYGKPRESVALMHEISAETTLVLWNED